MTYRQNVNDRPKGIVMKVFELSKYAETAKVKPLLTQSVVEALVATSNEAARIEFVDCDPVLVLLPLLRVSPSVAFRRTLHRALSFNTLSMDDDAVIMAERLVAWRDEHQTDETLMQSHGAMRQMFAKMFERARSRGALADTRATREDLLYAVLESGSPILPSFGENFVEYALRTLDSKSEPSFA